MHICDFDFTILRLKKGDRDMKYLICCFVSLLILFGAVKVEAVSFTSLGDLPGGSFSSQANGVSADGSVVVGISKSTSGNEAFRWTSGGGMVGLSDLSGGTFYSYAKGASSNGSVVVGTGYSASGWEAFRWTSGGGMVGLGDLSGGSFSSSANGVSSDGSVVVGRGTSASGDTAFRWTSGGGMLGLGDLPFGAHDSKAEGVSADGSVVELIRGQPEATVWLLGTAWAARWRCWLRI